MQTISVEITRKDLFHIRQIFASHPDLSSISYYLRATNTSDKTEQAEAEPEEGWLTSEEQELIDLRKEAMDFFANY